MAFRALLMSLNTDHGHRATISGVTLRAYELRALDVRVSKSTGARSAARRARIVRYGKSNAYICQLDV